MVLKARYESSEPGSEIRIQIVDELKALAQQSSTSGGEPTTAQLIAAQVLLQENQVAAAFQCVGGSSSSSSSSAINMEHLCTKLQILLKIDRLDLAKSLYQQIRIIDEDSIITQLCSVYIHLAEGRTGAADAEHTLNMLSEQYGPSSLLLNLVSCALLIGTNYNSAELKLKECLMEHTETVCADTYVNLITTYVHQNKMKEAYETLNELQSKYPFHPYHSGIERITTAFDREAIKYAV